MRNGAGAGGFFMIVMKDPDLARRLGLISAKAQIVAGSADWPTYLGMLAQATAIGGIMLFGLIGSWVFGREYSDHTLKDLALTEPVSAPCSCPSSQEQADTVGEKGDPEG